MSQHKHKSQYIANHFHPGLATIIVCSTAQMAQDYDENETVYRGRRDGL